MSDFYISKDLTDALTKKASVPQPNEYIAGGTDVMDRCSLKYAPDLISISSLAELKFIIENNDHIELGSLTTLTELLENPYILSQSGIKNAILNIANPQIRNTATIGGNLKQRNRCWYFRNSAYRCLKKGGDKCFAREGDNRNHAIFDCGPCISVHPSTLGLVLMAYDTTIKLDDDSQITLNEFFGDGSDPTRDNKLDSHRLIKSVIIPKAMKKEQSGYFRLIKREAGEWPTIELFVRISLDRKGCVENIVLIAGAVAPVPKRLFDVESFLIGKVLTPEVINEAAKLSITNTHSFSHNAYKVNALMNSVVALFYSLE